MGENTMARSLLQVLSPNPQRGIHGVIERTRAVLVVGDDVSVLADRATAFTRLLRDPLAVASAAGVAVRGL